MKEVTSMINNGNIDPQTAYLKCLCKKDNRRSCMTVEIL